MAYLKYTRLYEFSLGSKVWRYAASSQDCVDADGHVWEASAVSDDGPSQSSEQASDVLTVSCPSDLPVARLWMYTPPTRVMDFRILYAAFPEKVSNETGGPGAPIPVSGRRVLYVGEVLQCSFGQPGSASFSVETISDTMSRLGLHLGWQRQCPHAIYDPSTCKVNKAPHATACVVGSVVGNVVTVVGITDPPSGHYNAGILEFDHPIKGVEMLTVESSAGTSLRIFGSAGDIRAGMSVTIYPGCNQTPGRCKEFGNYENYGGFEMLPGVSPFNGVNNPLF